MNRSRLLLGGVLILVVLSLLVFVYMYFFSSRSTEKDISEEARIPAPEFSLPDADGKNISLESLEGEVKVLNFWASWSPYSRDELVALTKLKEEYGDRVAVVALNRDVNSVDGKAFLSSLGLGDTLLFAYDSNDEYFKKVQGFAMPETLFLDAEGNIIFQQHGPMSFEEMKAQVEAILQ